MRMRDMPQGLGARCGWKDSKKEHMAWRRHGGEGVRRGSGGPKLGSVHHLQEASPDLASMSSSNMHLSI